MRSSRAHILAVLLAAAASAALFALPMQASAARFGGWSAESGDDPVATISDLDVSHDAIAPGRRGTSREVELTFRSTIRQQLRIVVLDRSGHELRTIVDDTIAQGPARFVWNGRDDTGGLVADGDYELVVEASTRNESMSVSDIVRIDRRAPVVALPSRSIRLASLRSRRFLLPISASEQALLHVSTRGASGPGSTTVSPDAGRSSVTVPIRSLAAVRRQLARSGRARVVVRLVATDAAGNRRVRVAAVTLLEPSVYAPPVDTGPIVGSSRLSWPLSGPITSRFGPRWGRMHNGIDMGVPSGRRIGAAAPGRVTYSGWMSGYGNTVIVDHGSLETLYAHQSRIAVRTGQSVRRGQTVGYVGSTGNSTGPHLHFEVRTGGVAKDPMRYLP